MVFPFLYGIKFSGQLFDLPADCTGRLSGRQRVLNRPDHERIEMDAVAT